jgi:hypothetical protein
MDEVEITMSGRINDYYYFTLDNAIYREMEEARKYVNPEYSSKIETMEHFIAHVFSIPIDWLMSEENLERFPKLKRFATYPEENVEVLHRLIEDNAKLEIEVNGKTFCNKIIKEIDRSEIDEEEAENFTKSIKIPKRWNAYDELYSDEHIDRVLESTKRSEYGFIIANDQLFFNEKDEEYIYQDLKEGITKVLVDNDNENSFRIVFETDKFDPSKLIFVSRGDVEDYRNNPRSKLFCIYVVYDGEELNMEEGGAARDDVTVILGNDAWPVD